VAVSRLPASSRVVRRWDFIKKERRDEVTENTGLA